MTGIEKELESFLMDFEREAYEVGAGLKDDSDFTAIYERYPALFTHEAAEAAHLEIPIVRGRDSVVAFITVNIIDNALREDTDRLLTEELKSEITVDGKKIPYRQAQLLISNEHRPERRRDVDAARFAVLRKLNPMYAGLHERSHDMVKEMGYENYVDFFQKLEGVDLGALREHTEKFLVETENIYVRLLDEYRTSFLKIPADEIAQCDMAYMRRATRFEVMWGGTCRTNIVADDVLRARREGRPHMLELGYEVGMRQAGYGVESASPTILKNIDKSGQTLEKMELAIRETQRVLGYADCSFMIASPGETAETVRETVEFCRKVNLKPEVFFFTTAYPGTTFWHLALDKGLIRKAVTECLVA